MIVSPIMVSLSLPQHPSCLDVFIAHTCSWVPEMDSISLMKPILIEKLHVDLHIEYLFELTRQVNILPVATSVILFINFG